MAASKIPTASLNLVVCAPKLAAASAAAEENLASPPEPPMPIILL